MENTTLEKTQKFMLSSVESNILLKALEKLAFVSPKRSTMPILRNIRIVAKNSRIVLQATDSENNLSIDCFKCSNELIFDICIDAKEIITTLKKLEFNYLNFEVSESALVLATDDFSISFKLVDSSEYPDFLILESHTKKELFTLNSVELVKSLKSTIDFIRKEPSRYTMSGILMRQIENKLNFVATDSMSLAISKLDNFSFLGEFSEIISEKTAQFFTKFVKENQSIKISVEVNKFDENNNIFFEWDNIEFSSKLVVGAFPDFEKAIPSTDKKIVLNKKALEKALKTVSNFVGVSEVCSFLVHKDKLEIFVGSTKFFVKIESSTEDIQDFTINFKPKLFLKSLKHFKNETVSLNIKDNKRPVVIKEDNYVNIVMPYIGRYE